MERRTSYSRYICTPTAAARVADVKNKRETLLLAKTSKGLSCETDGTVRSFYRERAKTNDYLLKVQDKNSGMLRAKSNEKMVENEKFGFITGNEARDSMKVRRTRRPSLDVSQTNETQKRIQEFLKRDLPGQGSQSKNEQQLNAKNIEEEFGEKGFNSQKPLGPKSSEDKANVTSTTPFKVRSRTSGICFSHSHSHCHLLPLPSINVPNKERKSPEVKFRINSPCDLKKIPSRKLSTPIMVGQMSVERNTLDDVNTPYSLRGETKQLKT